MIQINFMYPVQQCMYNTNTRERVLEHLNQCAYGARGAGIEHTTTNIGDSEAVLLRGGWGKGETERKLMTDRQFRELSLD